MKRLSVIAFGGNALLKAGQAGTIQEQEKNVYETCQNLVGIIKSGYNIVICHGNGPQVGNVLLQHEAGHRIFGLPKQPIDFCVAETQGSIGFIIEQQLRNVLIEHGIKRSIVTLVTQVLVDSNDPAFQNPSKPVGPFFTADGMAALKREKPQWIFHKDPRSRGYRRVVASPKPVDIPNWEIVEKLVQSETIVITVGGGGIPAYIDQMGRMTGIDAVIDKDLASSLLAIKIRADEFRILTDVSNAYINFRKPDEKKLEQVFVSEVKKHLANGQFSEGSMAPKIRACIDFIDNGGREAIITEAGQLGNPGAGTLILAD